MTNHDIPSDSPDRDSGIVRRRLLPADIGAQALVDLHFDELIAADQAETLAIEQQLEKQRRGDNV